MDDEENAIEELDDAEDFGGDDLDPPDAPLAPTQHGGGGAPSPPPPELVLISKRIAGSIDNLEQQALVHSALCASIADVLADTTISAADRRRELRTISAAAAKSFPFRRLYDAEQKVKAAAENLEKRQRTKAGATAEKRAAVGGGKVIPIRLGG